jgi:hypothetical protein
MALDNYERKKITLKDSSTLITILIKSSKLIDQFFLKELLPIESIEKITEELKNNDDFTRIIKWPNSDKRNRQISTFMKLNFPYIHECYIDEIIKSVN